MAGGRGSRATVETCGPERPALPVTCSLRSERGTTPGTPTHWNRGQIHVSRPVPILQIF